MRMKSIPHLNALRALEASVRHGSFRSAATELGVTPAAVGQQVSNLEDILGRQLLVRHANGFVPSETTILASTYLSGGFGELQKALEVLARGDGRNRIFITVTPSIAERWLAPRLAKFMTNHPEIDLRIDSTPYLHYQTGSEFDFAFRYSRPGSVRSDVTRLFDETLIPVCTPEIASRIGPIRNSDCLAKVPLIHVDRSTDDPDWYHWEEWGQKFAYEIPQERSTQLHIAYTTLALRSLYSGHGLHLGQLSILLADLLSGVLVAPFGIGKCIRPGFHYNLVKTNAGKITRLQRAFRDWVASEAKETQSDIDAFLATHR